MQVFHMLFYLCRMLICPNIILNQPLYLVLHAFFGILIEMHSHNIHCATYLLSECYRCVLFSILHLCSPLCLPGKEEPLSADNRKLTTDL